MTSSAHGAAQLPSSGELLRAIRIYIDKAYAGEIPQAVRDKMPAEGGDPALWLMSDFIERDPANAPFDQVRSFKLRLGNVMYPHMKFSLSRPPKDPVFLFRVDSHDAFLHATPGSPDAAALADLKNANAVLVAEITASWEAAGLLTERTYLRRMIKQTKSSAGESAGGE